MANRSSGAFTPLKWHTFGIIIKLEKGGCIQQVVQETSAKRALGRLFGELHNEAKTHPELKPAAENAILFCKTAEQMTRDERFQWDLATDADHIAMMRGEDERRLERFNQLDMY